MIIDFSAVATKQTDLDSVVEVYKRIDETQEYYWVKSKDQDNEDIYWLVGHMFEQSDNEQVTMLERNIVFLFTDYEKAIQWRDKFDNLGTLIISTPEELTALLTERAPGLAKWV